MGNYHLLAEFSHLQTLKSPSKSTNGNSSLFQQFAMSGTPFDSLCQESLEEDILIEGGECDHRNESDSEDDLSEEQKQELVEENRDMGRTGLTPLARIPSSSNTSTTTPLTGLTVSNTAIMVLRLIGRYTHMMKVLTPIAEEVWKGICQLFEFYLYTVNMFFSRDLLDTEQSVYTVKLRDTLTSIYSTLLIHEVRDGEISKVVGCVREAVLSSAVELAGLDMLHGLPARLVGVESTIFLANQLIALKQYFTSLLDSSEIVDSFFLGTVAAAK